MSDCCGGKNIMIYACSGASDVGKISDHAARKLRDEGFGKMSCLAGVGANVSGYVETAKGADKSIVIDGCPVNCAKKIFQNAGINGNFFTLSEHGFEKGKTPVNDENVGKAAEIIKKHCQ